jgi:hypothetical protein
MRKFLLLIISCCCINYSFGQDATVKKLQDESGRAVKKEADTTNWTWKRGGLVNFNLNQGSLHNWAAGGDKFSLALNSYINYFLFHRKGNHNWDNTVDFNFGLLQTTSLGTRKNDDRLDLLSKYGVNFKGNWFLTGLVNFRTQFFDGYTFEKNVPVFSSTFLSPAYLLTSVGVDYKPTPNFSLFVSPATSRWIIVADDYLARKGLYGVDSGKHAVNEFGAFASVNYQKGMNKNVTYKGKLDLFSNYRHNPLNIDVFMTNFFSLKINRYFSVTYNLDAIYDDDVKLFGEQGKSPSLQLKSIIGIGFLKQLK